MTNNFPFPSGEKNASPIDFFDNVFTNHNESVKVNCCHLIGNTYTIEVATCGLGSSCAGSCSGLGASLCPSGDCGGDCAIPFETTNKIEARQLSLATLPATAFKWCSAQCNVWGYKGCCYHPDCREKSESHKKACRFFINYLTGVVIYSAAVS